ncbi:NnrS family protein [Cellvibrio sp.]|uniref:NnrS family protein n=1 Tax=Cellvibrio sp. TaxID=1965322 RepID=UPI0039648C06
MLKAINTSATLAYPFRILFLCCAVYAIVIVTTWFGILQGWFHLPIAWSPLYWHSHEMIFGFVAAAICGFLLTAMCNWTGAKPLTGFKLLSLVALWSAGRFAMWMGDALPPELVAVVDVAFLAVVAIYVARVLLHYGNKRNLILAVALALLTTCNLAMHAGAYTQNNQWMWAGETTALGLITLIMVIIGGRIIPLFTTNALRSQGINVDSIKNSTLVNQLSIFGTALLIPLNFFTQYSLAVGLFTLFVAGMHGVRLAQWRGWSTRHEPLLWILHIGYGWIVLALLFKGLHLLGAPIAISVWQHSLGVGAMSGLILGMMTRVSLGHTGRPLKLPRLGVAIYLAIMLAAMVRVLVALGVINFQWGLALATLLWICAFGVFIYRYSFILTTPRL